MSRAQEIADLLSGVTITTADNNAQLTLKSTDADDTSGPRLDLTRDSGSPADGDTIGRIRYLFDNDAAEQIEGVRVDGIILDASDGTEDCQFEISTRVAGDIRSRIKLGTETVFNEASQDIDFRIESNGNANMLFVDAGNDCIGISNNIPGSFYAGGNNLVVGSGSGSEGITIYGGAESNLFFADGTDIADNLRGRIEYSHGSEAMLFYTNNAYAMRIDSSRNLLVGRSSDALANVGLTINPAGHIEITRDNSHLLTLNRKNGDGSLIIFAQDNSSEGNITVAGSTVSLTGGHLARWSRLTSGNRDAALVKGTVMTNLDQMVVWHHEAQEATYYEAGDDLMIAPDISYKEGDTIPDGKKVGDIKTAAVYASIGDEKTPAVEAYDEDNEQLNCTAISFVEGDPNVAGVFVCWDEDDDFNDMHIAQTGDMVIRIASGTTVARGDLLMSAGDGTAKPQDDDIVRSKTIAKVTSTTKSHTYDDGTYLVPCVLMAC